MSFSYNISLPTIDFGIIFSANQITDLSEHRKKLVLACRCHTHGRMFRVMEIQKVGETFLVVNKEITYLLDRIILQGYLANRQKILDKRYNTHNTSVVILVVFGTY